MRLPWKNLLVLYVLIFSGVALATAATEPVKAPQNLPASVSPELEMAAKALAEGQLDTAAKWFEAAVQNTSARPLIRGLSMFGLAQVKLARQDVGAAIAAWERLACDTTLLRFHRDAGGRRGPTGTDTGTSLRRELHCLRHFAAQTHLHAGRPSRRVRQSYRP